jgi:hypothetical protein
MSLNFGPQVNLASGTFPVSGKVTIQVVNPRGKPTFSRRLTVKNTDTTPLTVIFPQTVGDTTTNPDISTTIAANTSQDFEGAITQLTLTGTSGKKYEVTATVAG